MPNFVSQLKAEIQRLARKEARTLFRSLRADTVALKRRGAEQKRQLAALTRQFSILRVATKPLVSQPVVTNESEVRAARISSGMVKRVRAKLGLTQSQLAKLIGVSPIAIYQWESKSGRLNLRHATRAAFLSIRGYGKREAAARLKQFGIDPTKNRRPRKATKPVAVAPRAAKVRRGKRK